MRKLDYLLVWFLMFGVWPLAHPEHDGATIMSAIDIGIHLTALVALMMRWDVNIRRRT